MDTSIYIAEAIYAWISSLIIFVILAIITKNIIQWSHIKMFVYLVIAMLIAVWLTTYFNPQLLSFVTETVWLKNYALWERVIEWFIFSIIFWLLMRNYLQDRKFLFIWIMSMATYIITTFYFTAWLYKLYYLIEELVKKFL